MPAAGFTIKLGEGENRISIDALAEALENALEMLRSVGQEFTPAGTVVRWEVVAASMRSPLTMRLRAAQGNGRLPRAYGKRIAEACVHGLAKLEREPELPPHFNDDALLAVQKLVKGTQKEGAKMTVAFDRAESVTPTAQAVENIKRVVEKARIYIDYGTLEGRLEEVSIHGGPHFVIWEALTNHRVECAVASELLDESMRLMGRRVAVTGRVRYRNRKPTLIQVESFRPLRDVNELPQLETMPPIDIAGGLSPEEYVRRMRDAQ